jgi:hypothetical protein
VAGGSLSTKTTGAFARVCHTLRYSKPARFLGIALFLGAIATTLFARPKQLESMTVRDIDIKSLSTTMEGQYVRVQGMFDPDLSYQRYLRLASGFQQTYRSHYVVMADPSSGAVIWIDRRSAPNMPANEPLTLVGRLKFGAPESQPPLFLVVEDPPNVRLANFLARAGIVVMMVALFVAATIALVHRTGYALPALFQHAPAVSDITGVLWFGALGRQYDDVVLQNEPGHFVASMHEGRVESTRAPGLWSVCIRRLRKVDLFDVATPAGALPAARIRFEDERGMQRSGVIAAGSVVELDAVLRLLQLIRA